MGIRFGEHQMLLSEQSKPRLLVSKDKKVCLRAQKHSFQVQTNNKGLIQSTKKEISLRYQNKARFKIPTDFSKCTTTPVFSKPSLGFINTLWSLQHTSKECCWIRKPKKLQLRVGWVWGLCCLHSWNQILYIFVIHNIILYFWHCRITKKC